MPFSYVAAAAHFSNVICGIQYPGAGVALLSLPQFPARQACAVRRFAATPRSTMFRFQAAQASVQNQKIRRVGNRPAGVFSLQGTGGGLFFLIHLEYKLLPGLAAVEGSAKGLQRFQFPGCTAFKNCTITTCACSSAPAQLDLWQLWFCPCRHRGINESNHCS